MAETKLTPMVIRGRQGETAKIVRHFAPGFVKKPHIDTMLADAYTIVSEELATLKRIVEAGERSLTPSEAKKFQILSDQLVKLAKEEREQVAQDKLDEKPDDELLLLAEEAKKILTPGG